MVLNPILFIFILSSEFIIKSFVIDIFFLFSILLFMIFAFLKSLFFKYCSFLVNNDVVMLLFNFAFVHILSRISILLSGLNLSL